jgi:DNA processing protein
MHTTLASADARPRSFFSGAVSPWRELGAYEALWLNPQSSFKTLAELFARHPGAVPSELVPEEIAEPTARRVVAEMTDRGISDFGVRVHGAGEYPQRLRDAEYPIELLYYCGDWDLAGATQAVAIVGTRQPSEEGIRRARKLVRRLVEDGVVIVSGLARGIDTVAHTTAIECGGKTIAVIGTPLCEVYPKENEELQRKIAEEHLLISQIPVLRYSQQSWQGNRLFFPQRNITMSALTGATIIVEAGETSGTLTQARAAISQDRELFIMESNFHNPSLTWPAKYERRGAHRLRDYNDLASRLPALALAEDGTSA